MGVVDWIKKKGFQLGLKDTRHFSSFVRPAAYALARSDPERVHEMALEAMVAYEDVIKDAAKDFNFPELYVDVAGKQVMPFGTAAGLDKNGDALSPLSHLFGFLEWGTVVVQPRPGNNRPRVAVDDAANEIYNAQGFPHKGLEYALDKAAAYHAREGKAPLLTSICGIPPQPEQLDIAYQELEKLVDSLNLYSDGFVWNPFSPNTGALKALRTPSEFRKSAELLSKKVGSKLKLVKMGPYDDNEIKRKEWLGLVDAWMQGGGDGVVAVNTYMVPKEQVPSKDWGYPSAGRSGTFLQDYRQRAIKDTRAEFPKAFIAAAGGIDSGEQAWNAFVEGANVLEGYTPYTFKGFGLLIEMSTYVANKLRNFGYTSLKEYQKRA